MARIMSSNQWTTVLLAICRPRHRYFWLLVLISMHLLPVSGGSSDSFYFSVNPTDQDVEEGQPLRLRCTVSPSKDIFYSWIHNGTQIPLDSTGGGGQSGAVEVGRRRYLEMDSNLQIMHADRDLDQGIYQCQALNRSSLFTTASQEARVNIYWMEPDAQVVLVKPNRFEEILLGHEVEFACQVNANPPLSASNIKWYHNGNARLPNTEVLRNGNLRIGVLGMEHVGSYHCRVLHAAGRLDSRPPFVLQMTNVDPPQLITSLANEQFNIFVLRGHTTELTCPKLGAQDGESGADAMPPITVWGYMPHLGDQQQTVSHLSDVQLVDLDSKLIIHNFDHSHVNYYTCEIGWPGSPERNTFIFQVEMATLYNPKRSDFSPRLKKNQPYIVRIHEDAMLRYYSDQSPQTSFIVNHISNPPPKIEWYKKGEPGLISAWPGRKAEFGAEPYRSVGLAGSSTKPGPQPRRYAHLGRHLVIRNVNEADSGTYEMVLTNTAGRLSMHFEIIVTFPPEFKQPLSHEEHSLDEDASIALECGIHRRAVRGSVVFWEKDQRLLETFSTDSVILENNGEMLRFPKLKPEHQGQYQCFVQTEGYQKRAAGREQTLIVKGRLQFLREIREHFLEVNVQGRIPCKVRGYGQLNVNWFRKTGPRPEDFQEIRPPNQVEAGTLIIQYVQKHDAGDYVCVAQSSYRNSRINMTVKVIVGEKPHISQISSNQTVQVGSQVILHCQASGDPRPQISWIVKKIGMKSPLVYTPVQMTGSSLANSPLIAEAPLRGPGDAPDVHPTDADLVRLPRLDMMTGAATSMLAPHPDLKVDGLIGRKGLAVSQESGSGRVTAYPNGSLVIQQAHLVDQAEYICVAGNKHAIKTRQGVFVRVLTAEEYNRRQLNGAAGQGNSGMMKTIGIVVGCAVAYLGLIVGLTVFCSLQMLRTRRKRSRKAPRCQDNGQLMLPVSEASVRGATIGNRAHHGGKKGPGHPRGGSTNPLLDTATNLTLGNPDDSQSLSYMYQQQQNVQSASGFVAAPSAAAAAGGGGAPFYTPTSTLCNGSQRGNPLQQQQQQQYHFGNGLHQPAAIGAPVNSSATLSPVNSHLDPSWWLPISSHVSAVGSNQQAAPGNDGRIPVSPAGTMFTSEANSFDQTCEEANRSSLPDDLLQCPSVRHHFHHGHYPSYSQPGGSGLHYGGRAAMTDDLGAGGQLGNSGGGGTVVTTAASDSHVAVVSAPPPTPLDSRSHLSGMSSGGNSTSLYSRSLLSGASNGGGSAGLPTASAMLTRVDVIPKHSVISQTDCINFTRSELKIEGMLGKGEFGDVFVARPHGSSSNKADETAAPPLVLVKSLTSHNSTHVNEFHRQLELFGKADSPYVTRLLGVCMEKEPFYMLLEYCEWGDLKMYLRRVREDTPPTAGNFKLPALTSGQKLVICRQLAAGTHYLASQLHCVHRDLAARNVFITPCRMEVKLGSPGLARDTYASDYYLPPGGDQPVPLRWLSPDLVLALARGQALPYSTASDVWAFGTLLWEVYSLADRPLAWLTDQELVGVASRLALEAEVAGAPSNTQTLRPREQLPGDMPPEVVQLLSRAWSYPSQYRADFAEITLVLNPPGDCHL